LARNWRCAPLGELDIVAQGDDCLVFVEVRTRRGPLADAVQAALESVRTVKQRRLLELAQAYLAEHELEGQPWRVDVAAVAAQQGTLALEVIHDALEW
jgi:putative endonuclease